MRRTLFLAIAVCATHAHAGITWYDHPALWGAAAGPPSYFETFDGFATDLSFTSSPVASAAGAFSQESLDGNTFRNFIDVPPLVYTDNNGTKHASLFTNGHEAGVGTDVRLTFFTRHTALSFLTWDAMTLEGATIDVFDDATLLGSHDLSGGAAEFTGFVLDGGMSATSVRFRSTSTVAGMPGEGFGLDDIRGVHAPVPEPATTALACLALAATARRRRFRQPTR
ncbi:MAG: PEP-CTERM sorting domain-containing protein [Fimbriimonadaceae bacterium]|nr:PEP-CTERM sorting domain-containing protein [Chthonomonadaceae bacterium]MCO5295263.1 PEP-CTERM sorting domain-containing protein [Fimbriimonadaceae bacterium]